MKSVRNVQYSYAGGSDNTIRMTGMTYPNGRIVSMSYGTANDINDASSRIESMTDNGVTLASYQYLGSFGLRECGVRPARNQLNADRHWQ